MLIQEVMKKDKYIIDKELEGIRLDKAICSLDKEVSRVAVQRLIEESKINVNRKA